MNTPGYVTYQLAIALAVPQRLVVGKLGIFDFPPGHYIYTGSARRNLEARITRHLSHEKRLHWHIDYLTTSPHATVTEVTRFSENECALNQRTDGTLLIPGFGASDCRTGCGSHLKYLGK